MRCGPEAFATVSRASDRAGSAPNKIAPKLIANFHIAANCATPCRREYPRPSDRRHRAVLCTKIAEDPVNGCCIAQSTRVSQLMTSRQECPALRDIFSVSGVSYWSCPQSRRGANGDPNPILPPAKRRLVPAWTVGTAHGASDARSSAMDHRWRVSC
jgi:hypothetical protein